MSKVSDSATADGSTPFFKIYQDTWGKNAAGSTGSDDYWGTKDLNKHCGKLDIKIPTGLAPGDYLLRAEAIALHSAGGSGGAQVNHYPPTHEVHALNSVKPVLPHLLSAYYYRKRHYQPDRCQLPWSVQGVRSRNSHQYLPEAYSICRAWTSCHLRRHRSCRWQGWINTWKAHVSEAAVLVSLNMGSRTDHKAGRRSAQFLRQSAVTITPYRQGQSLSYSSQAPHNLTTASTVVKASRTSCPHANVWVPRL